MTSPDRTLAQTDLPGVEAAIETPAEAPDGGTARGGPVEPADAGEASPQQRRYEYLLVIGPGRSGSEFLYRNLKLHPWFSSPEIKEGYYYRSVSRYGKARSISPDTILADVSNHARDDPGLGAGVERLIQSGDRVLLVLLLRVHRDRAVSIVRFRRSRGHLSALGTLRHLKRSVVQDMLTVSELRRAFATRADIMAIDFETLTADPEAVLGKLCDACGVPPPVETIGDKVNQSAKARFLPLSAVGLFAAKSMRRIGLRKPLQRLKDSSWIRKVFWVPGKDEIGFSDEELQIFDRLWSECSAYVEQHTERIADGIRFRQWRD